MDLTFHFLINEYKMLTSAACDSTFVLAQTQARMKAQLLRDAIRRGVVVLDES